MMKFNVYFHIMKDGGVSIVPHDDNPLEAKDLEEALDWVLDGLPTDAVGLWVELASVPPPRRPDELGKFAK